MNSNNKYIIAIDFDGTLTMKHEFPEIGNPRVWLIEKAKKWKKEGHRLILWTCREDIKESTNSIFSTRDYLTEALEWCKGFNLEFDVVNQNISEESSNLKFSRKIFADYYIDDKSVVFDDSHNNLITKPFLNTFLNT
jgi:hydroxymethylpyrimidine pyrophosphatase-like HAD family hydrolase